MSYDLKRKFIISKKKNVKKTIFHLTGLPLIKLRMKFAFKNQHFPLYVYEMHFFRGFFLYAK